MTYEALAREFGIEDVAVLDATLREALLIYQGIADPGWPDVRVDAARLADQLDAALALIDGDSQGWLGIGLASQDQEAEASFDRLDIRVRALRELRDMARAASEGEPAAARGRPPTNEALRAFVLRLADYWRNDLGRPFTQDFHDLEPVSPAARFVVGAARACGVQATNQQIRTVMVDVVRFYRKSADLS